MSALRQVAEYLIDTLELPEPLRESLKQNITKRAISLPCYEVHVSNHAMASLEAKWQIGYSYEDTGLYGRDGLTRAEDKWTQLQAIAPGRYVRITTGDHIFATDAEPDSHTYDAHYYHYIVEASVWQRRQKRIMALDAEWRTECRAKLYQKRLPRADASEVEPVGEAG